MRTLSRISFVSAFVSIAIACGSHGGGGGTATVVTPDSRFATPACTDENAAERLRHSLVRVGAGGTGTNGVVAYDGLILTTFLPARVGDPVTVTIGTKAEDGTLTAQVGYFQLIDAATPGLTAVSWGFDEDLKQGQRVLAMGFAPDTPGEARLTGGVFSAIRKRNGIPAVETDLNLPAGIANAPLFTQCGDVIGLAFAQQAGEGALGIPASSAKDALFSLVADREHRMQTATAEPGTSGPAATMTPPPEAAREPVCGTGASINFDASTVVGHKYGAGEAITLDFDFAAPICKSAAARVVGYFDANSPMYQYWCVAPAPEQDTGAHCDNGRFVDAWATSDQTALGGKHVRISIAPSLIRPASPANVDPSDGFTVCQVNLELNEAKFPGHVYTRDYGQRCEDMSAPLSRSGAPSFMDRMSQTDG